MGASAKKDKGNGKEPKDKDPKGKRNDQDTGAKKDRLGYRYCGHRFYF